MSKVEVKVPDIGGADVEVIELCVQPGDQVAVDDSLIVVESDKASMEIPSSGAGAVLEFKVKVGDKVSEGDLILLLDGSGSESNSSVPEDSVSEPVSPVEEAKPEPAAKSPAPKAAGGTATETVYVPDIGGAEGVAVIELSVKEGDVVAEDDPLIVLESDKATMEIPSPKAGTVKKLLVQLDAKVDEGTAIAELEVENNQSAEPSEEPATVTSPAQVQAPPKLTEPARAPIVEADVTSSGKMHAGPAVRKLAREFGVDLAQIKGSGRKGRVIKEDVQAFVKQGMQQLKTGSGAGSGVGLPTVTLPDFSKFGSVERRPMTRIHQLTAENMARSWLTVPHVTQFDDADITELEAFRKAQKAAAEAKGVKLTPMPFILKACAYAIQTFPQFNVSLDMDTREVVQKSYINIGMAVDTPDGLVVPVIRDVDKKGLWEIAQECIDLAGKAKGKKLKPAEMQGGCFTISSLGNLGGTAFTPIVNTPEVAILGVSKSQMRPVYNGNDFVPRLMLPLSLSYDHRAINGADAARFTSLLCALLGDIRKILL